MSTTLAPVSASEMARLAVVVDLPSPGPALEMTKLRGPRPMLTNCRFVRRLRKDSARGLRGSACTMSGRVFASGSSAMPPSSGLSVICEMSCREWMRVSSTLRSTAMPMPIARPTSAPSARLSGTLGLDALLRHGRRLDGLDLHAAGSFARRLLEVVHHDVGEGRADRIRDLGGELGIAVAHRDIDQDGVERRARLDLCISSATVSSRPTCSITRSSTIELFTTST